MKKYIMPTVKVVRIDNAPLMQAASPSVNPTTPTSGLGGDGTSAPGMGGQSDGSHPVGSKPSIWRQW